MRVLASLLPLAVPTSAIGLLLPLYIYPGDSASAWAPAFNAIAAYPSVQWQVIVNPNSGPGTTLKSPYPDANYIAGIKKLNAASNVQTLGYVDTLYGNRAMSAVYSDINNYTYWASYKAADISMDGIFFDDVTSIYDFQTYPNTKTPNETYYRNISTYAYNTVPSDVTPVVFNPGNPGDSTYYSYCDTMVEYEQTFANYKGQTTLTSIKNNGGILAQSAVIINTTPASTTNATINSIFNTMKSNKLQFAYLTQDCCYNKLNQSLLAGIASAANSA